MKTIFTLLCCTLMLISGAQEMVKKSFPVKSGQELELSFDYPKTITLSTWSGNEVQIEASVEINGGQNNDAFILESKEEGNKLIISNRIKDIDKLPHQYSIVHGTEKLVFSSKEAMKEHTAKLKGENYYTRTGIDMEITITVKIPATMTNTIAKAQFGSIDARFDNAVTRPITLQSVFGHVDVTVPVDAKANLSLNTSWGEILASADLRIEIDRTGDSKMVSYRNNKIRGKLNGGGTDLTLTSTHGKVYLRKS